jgi:exonuclease SbcD
MKIFHTADWHIGKLISGFYMTDDQAYIMEQLYAAIRAEKPDVLLIAGDLYDRSVPPVQAIELLNRVLGTIVIDLKTPVIALAGNHDSNERIDFASDLLKNSGLYLSGTLRKEIAPVVLNDEYGPVYFYSIPYTDPAVVRELYNDESIRTHDQAMKAVIDSIAGTMDRMSRNVALAHGYVTGIADDGDAVALEESESEKPLSIGGTACINASHFDAFHYTALGHLHGPQKAGSEKIRYAGSLLKYSFSETAHRKGITVADLDEKGDLTTGFIGLKPLRDFRILKGELKSLMSNASGANVDYIRAVLTDKGELLDPMSKLRSVYPNIMELFRDDQLRTGQSAHQSSAAMREKTRISLFESFYEEMTGEPCPLNYVEEMEKIIHRAEKEGAE